MSIFEVACVHERIGLVQMGVYSQDLDIGLGAFVQKPSCAPVTPWRATLITEVTEPDMKCTVLF